MKYLFLALCCIVQVYAKPSDKITPLDFKAREIFEISQIGQIYANDAIYTIRLSKIKSPKTPPKSYKIFYLLDGNGHLPIALNALSKQDILRKQLESVLIVSIGYGDEYEDIAFPILRRRDYTPKINLDYSDFGSDFIGGHSSSGDFGSGDFLGGGADKFLQTLQNDIIPFTHLFVQEKLEAEIAGSGIFGHSFGGLFVLYALSNSSGIFSHFYAVSPSLWWGNGEFIGRDIDFKNIKGDYMILWIMQDSQKVRDKNRKAKINSKELAHLIKSQSNITTIYKEFYGTSHGSVLTPAFLQAISDFAKNGF